VSITTVGPDIDTLANRLMDTITRADAAEDSADRDDRIIKGVLTVRESTQPPSGM
ncbi:MAG: hypothetical protein K0R28_6742, partial [Paenibacillus sp.]|nr:hypothetical protein [Paenibacillus sp.]